MSVACLYDDGHALQFTKDSCILKMKSNISGVGRLIDEMYAVDFQRVVGQQVFDALEKETSAFGVWHVRLAHNDRPAVKGMAEKDAFRDMDIHECCVLDVSSRWTNGKMANMAMRSRIHVRVRTGAVKQIGFPTMKMPSVEGVRYLAAFIGEVSGHVRAFRINLEGKAAELLELQASWVERQSRCMEKRILLDGIRKYVMDVKDIPQY